jgi:hypothetical protein
MESLPARFILSQSEGSAIVRASFRIRGIPRESLRKRPCLCPWYRPGAHAGAFWALLHRRPQQALAHLWQVSHRHRPPGSSPAPQPAQPLHMQGPRHWTSEICLQTVRAVAPAPPPPAPGCPPTARRAARPTAFSSGFRAGLDTRDLDVGYAGLSDRGSPRSSSGPEIRRMSCIRLVAADHGVGTGAFLHRIAIPATGGGVPSFHRGCGRPGHQPRQRPVLGAEPRWHRHP